MWSMSDILSWDTPSCVYQANILALMQLKSCQCLIAWLFWWMESIRTLSTSFPSSGERFFVFRWHLFPVVGRDFLCSDGVWLSYPSSRAVCTPIQYHNHYAYKHVFTLYFGAIFHYHRHTNGGGGGGEGNGGWAPPLERSRPEPPQFQLCILVSMPYTIKEASKLLLEGLRNTLWGSKIPNFPGGACPHTPLDGYWLLALIFEAWTPSFCESFSALDCIITHWLILAFYFLQHPHEILPFLLRCTVCTPFPVLFQ